MAQAARPSAPNPCAAFRPPPPPPLPARRPDATVPSPARPKDAPCPASNGDRGHSGQCKRAPETVMHKPSGGKQRFGRTYARRGKQCFGRTVGSDDLQKRHCRSVTPPPSSRRVCLARSTPPQKTSSISAKRYETAGNRQTVSLKRPSPFCRAVQRGAVPPVVHVLPAHSSAPLFFHTEPRKKTYRPDACWKGKFEVTGELTHTCDEIEAHFPLEIFIKVYEASKRMPEVLKLEAVPLSHLLLKKFKMEPPDAQDIGLCFISSHERRPNRNFDHLLEKISSHIGLRTDIGTTELLIFSSMLLTEDDQRKDGNFYFCGVFRKHLRKKSGIKLELTGEEQTNGINKCMPMLKMPDANATGSPCKAAMRAPACGDLIVDSPPGFPLEVPPPGFTSAHGRLRRGETASSSLALDREGDVPPGFTPAHRGLHPNGVSTVLLSEKKSPIKLSLGVTRPVQTDDIPPGFSKPLGNVNEKEIKHDKLAVEVDDGSEERLSDILGFSSSNNASTLSSKRNCSQVCRSAAAAVPRASKFQETGPPEIEKLCRKRGQPEPSESSAAEASKRLKVNGPVDGRALSSN